MSQQPTTNRSAEPEVLLKLLNERIVDHLASYPYQTSELLEAASYSVESPGHRWRPILFLVVYKKLAGKDVDDILPIACAIEYIHTASIILDDLPSMDDATLRRGKRACHLEFGQSRAILAAHWLCDVAQYLIHEFQLHSRATAVVDLEDFFRQTKNRMMKGQILDLEGGQLTTDEVIEKYRLKSGALYAFSASAPAHFLSFTEIAKKLENFGNYLGIAYQISDDIHDCVGTTQGLGKDVHKDESKNTIPLIHGIKKATELSGFYKKKAIAELTVIPEPLDDLIDLVDKICL